MFRIKLGEFIWMIIASSLFFIFSVSTVYAGSDVEKEFYKLDYQIHQWKKIIDENKRVIPPPNYEEMINRYQILSVQLGVKQVKNATNISLKRAKDNILLTVIGNKEVLNITSELLDNKIKKLKSTSRIYKKWLEDNKIDKEVSRQSKILADSKHQKIYNLSEMHKEATKREEELKQRLKKLEKQKNLLTKAQLSIDNIINLISINSAVKNDDFFGAASTIIDTGRDVAEKVYDKKTFSSVSKNLSNAGGALNLINQVHSGNYLNAVDESLNLADSIIGDINEPIRIENETIALFEESEYFNKKLKKNAKKIKKLAKEKLKKLKKLQGYKKKISSARDKIGRLGTVIEYTKMVYVMYDRYNQLTAVVGRDKTTARLIGGMELLASGLSKIKSMMPPMLEKTVGELLSYHIEALKLGDTIDKKMRALMRKSERCVNIFEMKDKKSIQYITQHWYSNGNYCLMPIAMYESINIPIFAEVWRVNGEENYFFIPDSDENPIYLTPLQLKKIQKIASDYGAYCTILKSDYQLDKSVIAYIVDAVLNNSKVFQIDDPIFSEATSFNGDNLANEVKILLHIREALGDELTPDNARELIKKWQEFEKNNDFWNRSCKYNLFDNVKQKNRIFVTYLKNKAKYSEFSIRQRLLKPSSSCKISLKINAIRSINIEKKFDISVNVSNLPKEKIEDLNYHWKIKGINKKFPNSKKISLKFEDIGLNIVEVSLTGKLMGKQTLLARQKYVIESLPRGISNFDIIVKGHKNIALGMPIILQAKIKTNSLYAKALLRTTNLEWYLDDMKISQGDRVTFFAEDLGDYRFVVKLKKDNDVLSTNSHMVKVSNSAPNLVELKLVAPKVVKVNDEARVKVYPMKKYSFLSDNLIYKWQVGNLEPFYGDEIYINTQYTGKYKIEVEALKKINGKFVKFGTSSTIVEVRSIDNEEDGDIAVDDSDNKGVETGDGSGDQETKGKFDKDNKTPETVEKPEKEEVPKDDTAATIPEGENTETGAGKETLSSKTDLMENEWISKIEKAYSDRDCTIMRQIYSKIMNFNKHQTPIGYRYPEAGKLLTKYLVQMARENDKWFKKDVARYIGKIEAVVSAQNPYNRKAGSGSLNLSEEEKLCLAKVKPISKRYIKAQREHPAVMRKLFDLQGNELRQCAVIDDFLKKYDIPSSLVIPEKYKNICGNAKEVQDEQRLSVSILGDRTVMANQSVTLNAIVKGGRKPMSVEWRGDNFSPQGKSAIFVSSVPGSYTLSVTVKDASGQRSSDSISILVKKIDLPSLNGLAQQVYYGTSSQIVADGSIEEIEENSQSQNVSAGTGIDCKTHPSNPFCVDTNTNSIMRNVTEFSDGGHVGVVISTAGDQEELAPATGLSKPAKKKSIYEYVWRASKTGIMFDPPIGHDPRVKVTFGNMGEIEIWAEVKKDGELLGETEPVKTKAIPPKLTMTVKPEAPYIGEESVASIKVEPNIDNKYLNFRWLPMGKNVQMLGEFDQGKKYRFKVKNNHKSTIEVLVWAQPYAEEQIADLKQVISAKPYKVSMSKPKRLDKAPWIWDPIKGTAIEQPLSIAVFQDAEVHATITPQPKGKVSYKWSVTPDGCSVSAPMSKSTYLNAHEVGTYNVMVEVTGENGIELGKGAGTFTATISQRDMDVVKQKEKEKQKAQKLLTQSRKLWKAGKLQQAITKAAQAKKFAGKEREISKTFKAMQNQKKNLDRKLNEAVHLIGKGKLKEADKVLDQAARINDKYGKYIEVLKRLSDAKKKVQEKMRQATKLLKDAKALQDAGKLSEAGTVLKKGSKLFTGNKEIGKLLKEVQKQQNDALKKMKEGQTQWKNGLFEKAVSTLKKAVKSDPSNKKIAKVLKGMQSQKRIMVDALRKVDKFIEQKKFKQAESALVKAGYVSKKYLPYIKMVKKLYVAEKEEKARQERARKAEAARMAKAEAERKVKSEEAQKRREAAEKAAKAKEEVEKNSVKEKRNMRTKGNSSLEANNKSSVVIPEVQSTKNILVTADKNIFPSTARDRLADAYNYVIDGDESHAWVRLLFVDPALNYTEGKSLILILKISKVADAPSRNGLIIYHDGVAVGRVGAVRRGQVVETPLDMEKIKIPHGRLELILRAAGTDAPYIMSKASGQGAELKIVSLGGSRVSDHTTEKATEKAELVEKIKAIRKAAEKRAEIKKQEELATKIKGNNIFTINNPKVNGVALDYCREWAKYCGKPAADAWCKANGYTESVSYITKNDTPPTRIISTGKICNSSQCDRIIEIKCKKGKKTITKEPTVKINKEIRDKIEAIKIVAEERARQEDLAAKIKAIKEAAEERKKIQEKQEKKDALAEKIKRIRKEVEKKLAKKQKATSKLDISGIDGIEDIGIITIDEMKEEKQEKSTEKFTGTLKGDWSGKGTGRWKGWTSSGNFVMHISKEGKISGSYDGDDEGKLSGFINSSGKLNMKSGGGAAGSGTWGGSIKIDASGRLNGNGTWSVDGFDGTWRGKGEANPYHSSQRQNSNEGQRGSVFHGCPLVDRHSFIYVDQTHGKIFYTRRIPSQATPIHNFFTCVYRDTHTLYYANYHENGKLVLNEEWYPPQQGLPAHRKWIEDYKRGSWKKYELMVNPFRYKLVKSGAL